MVAARVAQFRLMELAKHKGEAVSMVDVFVKLVFDLLTVMRRYVLPPWLVASACALTLSGNNGSSGDILQNVGGLSRAPAPPCLRCQLPSPHPCPRSLWRSPS